MLKKRKYTCIFYLIGLLFIVSPFYPAMQSDNYGKIAFISNRDGRIQIYTMDADGSNATSITPDFFDNEEDREQEQFIEFLATLTREAAAANEKSSEEKRQLSARLNQFIEILSDTREGRDLKSYFRLLLAIVNGKDYQEHLAEISEELKEFFQEIMAS